ncbi:integral membrane protein GPR137 [Denticeps clupeoides]|uniref:Integral membrane protein n=1 Tax=Denticeps clupeoides TaxID=299321 RepID=A0AAY4D3C7_9TELE|nr:integral membrane protein GPR137-like [Denticeps clupeoides]XP_028816086.1 integral membrane protein GPR137-like [Denticeps clupeoides]
MDAGVSSHFPPNSSLPTPAPIRPAVAPSVQLGFTILYTSLYGVLFLTVLAQLWLLLIYGHKRWSYQSVFLFLCLLWSGLRTTLFSFYFSDPVVANHLAAPLYWLLYCCPVCLQFFTLSLFNLYFTQVLLKVRLKYNSEPSRRLCLARVAYAAMSVVFLCVNVACAGLGERDSAGDQNWRLVLVRVLVNDLLFMAEAICLAVSLLLLTQLSPSTGPYLQSKGTTLCQTAFLGAGVILLFSSRACYNLAVLVLSQNHKVESFNYDWYNVSDQADLQSELGDRGYLAFGAILFIWELLPTSLLILIFRVRRPSQEKTPTTVNNNHGTRSYFFDDPRTMEDDFAVPWSHNTFTHSSWFGTSETTPLIFASSTDRTKQHHTLYSTPQS